LDTIKDVGLLTAMSAVWHISACVSIPSGGLRGFRPKSDNETSDLLILYIGENKTHRMGVLPQRPIAVHRRTAMSDVGTVYMLTGISGVEFYRLLYFATTNGGQHSHQSG
jgi:hypothetical protein